MTRPITGFRRVQTLHGDTLQAIAARELGDAALWPTLADMNRLAPPYLTGDEALVGPRVRRYGDTIMVPAPYLDIRLGSTWAEDVFGADVALPGGALQVADGDLAIIAGRDNLRQALVHRITSRRGELIFHLEYGSEIHTLLAQANNQAALLLASKFAVRCVLADDRIAAVSEAVAEAAGDTIAVDVVADTVTGHPLNIAALAGG